MKQMTICLFSILFLFKPLINNAQNKSTSIIKGIIFADKKPVEAAEVSLFNAKDSTKIKATITNSLGEFEFLAIQKGKYFIISNAVGFKKLTSATFQITDIQQVFTLPNLTMQLATKELANVTVTSKKAFIEQKLDRTIINVEALPTNAGLTVLEILEKTPGVVVDKDGNISLKGKQGVLVLIDGRPTYLSGQDLSNMLRNMAGSNLDQLEIMTNPPAKFDASGNSGLINIKTKKTKTVGLNGSLSTNYGQGVYPKASQSINLNYRINKFNFFTNGSYSYRENFQNINISRNFIDVNTNSIISNISQLAQTHRTHHSYTYKAGADYFVNKKTTLGVVFNGFNQTGEEPINNTANITNAHGLLITKNLANNLFNSNMKNWGLNVNYRKLIDTSGTELTVDLDYLKYNSNNQQSLNNYFFDAAGNKKDNDEIMRGQLPSIIHIYSAKTDYTKSITKSIKLEAGLKSSYVQTDNNALYENFLNNTWVVDATRSNHFKYQENINAAYVNVNKTFTKKWSIQTGLRLENTLAKGHQIRTNEKFERNYTQLFPTVYVGYNLNEKNQFAISYGRRIDRPSYEDLNPFFFFLDKYTYQVGNPYLQPQFSHNIELKHTFGGILTTTLNYSHTKDIMQEIFEQVDSTNTTFIKNGNIAQMKNLGLAVNAMIPITKWWKMNVYANVYNNKYEGIISGGNVRVNGTTFSGNFNNQFNFKKGWSAELSGFYQSREIGGIIVANPMGAVNIALAKQILKNKGSIKLSLRDVFFTQNFSGYSKYQNIDLTINQNRDSRVVNIGFTYRFGKGKPTQQRKINGANAEQSRVKSAGGN